jgi:hypothetical protein
VTEQKTQQCVLYKLPREIRDLIYQHCLADCDGGSLSGRICTSTSFLGALRPEPQLYEEALEMYYKTHDLVLSRYNIEGFLMRLPNYAAEFVRNFRFEIDKVSQYIPPYKTLK